MIKRNKEQNPRPSIDTVVPKTKWKSDVTAGLAPDSHRC